MIHKDQRAALMAFVEAALAGSVAAGAITWADQNQAVGGQPWATLRHLSGTTDGQPSEVPVDEGGTPTLYTVAHRETAWEIQVGYIQPDPPDPDLDASALLSRVELRLHSSVATYAMRKLGLAPKRMGDVVNISGVPTTSGAESESRASMTVVFSYAEIEADTTTSTIESMQLTGTVDPVPGTVGGGTIGP